MINFKYNDIDVTIEDERYYNIDRIFYKDLNLINIQSFADERISIENEILTILKYNLEIVVNYKNNIVISARDILNKTYISKWRIEKSDEYIKIYTDGEYIHMTKDSIFILLFVKEIRYGDDAAKDMKMLEWMDKYKKYNIDYKTYLIEDERFTYDYYVSCGNNVFEEISSQ